MVQGGTRALHQPGAALQKVPCPGFATYVGIDADRLARIRLPSPAAALAGGIEVALERIGILDGARIPSHLETGQQFDITRRTAAVLQVDTFGLVGRLVLGPVLLQRIQCGRLVGQTGFLVAPGHDGTAPGGFATRSDLQSWRPGYMDASDPRSIRSGSGGTKPGDHAGRPEG